MSILILKPGLLDTLQDLGRYGYSQYGINPGGSMDRVACQVANMLVGNSVEEPVLEMHFPAPQILFEQTAMISICGADFSPMLNNQPIPLWQPIVVRKDCALHFDNFNQGGRCYLALHGGFESQPWLNSSSTNLKAKAGGFYGRKLEKLDRLFQKESRYYFPGWLNENKDRKILGWRTDIQKIYENPRDIYITEGQEFARLETDSKSDLINESFLVHPSSDRMGYQLKGNPLSLKEKIEMTSTGVHFGTIQLLPGGQMVVLMADHQTTGGYPRIAHVIAAHYPKLAQLRPSDSIQFSIISMEYAEALYFAQQTDLSLINRGCEEHLKNLVC